MHVRIPLQRLATTLLLVGLALPAAAADMQRIEAVGVTPLGTQAGGRQSPRDRALRAALSSAVRQVANQHLSGMPRRPPEAVVAQALGEDPFEYASRFRVLEDRGAQPAVVTQDPTVTSEYVVVAEIHVDAARVRSRLAQAGLLGRPSGERVAVRTRIAIEDLSSWGEVQAVRQLLRDMGATQALPVEVEHGRAVLEVATTRSPARLLQELVRRAPESLELEPRGAGPDGLRLRARVLAPPEPAPAAMDDAVPFDTPGAERY